MAPARRRAGPEQHAGGGATALLPLLEREPEAFGCSGLKFNRGHGLKYVLGASDEISRGEAGGTPRTEGPGTKTDPGTTLAGAASEEHGSERRAGPWRQREESANEGQQVR